jgi:hypothetical protein
MPCIRCGGLVIENWWDCVEDVSQKKLQGTRCVNCGAIDDPVIEMNRLRPHRARITVPRGIAAGMGHVPVSLVRTWPNSIRTPRMRSLKRRIPLFEEGNKGMKDGQDRQSRPPEPGCGGRRIRLLSAAK